MGEQACEIWLVAGTGPATSDVGHHWLDGARCRTKRSLFEHWAARLSFPGYFSRNWDAFADCLADFTLADTAGGTGLVLTVENAGDLLADGEDADLAVLVEVLRDTVEDMRSSPDPSGRADITVEFSDTPAHLAKLRRRLPGG
ncbi:barstar family protein [Sinosporangium album]|nr:barstar family protein [Sinosporangium album]